MAKKSWYVRLRLDNEDYSDVVIYRHIPASDKASAIHMARRRLHSINPETYQDYFVERVMEEVY